MPTNTPDQGLTVMANADPATIPANMTTLVGQIESRLAKRYANEADRTARNPTPTPGEMSYLTTPGRFDRAKAGPVWWEAEPSFVFKAAEAQVVNNSTAFVNDSHLALPLPFANARYMLDGLWFYDSGTTADIKWDWTGPAGFTMPHWAVTGDNTSLVVSVSGSTAASTAVTRGGAGIGTFESVTLKGMVVTAGTTGTLQLRWAQSALEAVNTRMKIPSWISLTRVG